MVRSAAGSRRWRGPRWRVFALAVLVFVAGCTGNVELLSDIPEAEAYDVVAALAGAGLKAQKLPGKDGLVKLMVEQNEVAKAVSVLNAEGLPRQRYATMGDVFRKEGLISSPLEERARYLWALSQELSATVAQLDGVLKARVHVVLPERGAGGEPPMPSSAAVFIKYQRGYNLQSSIPQVRQLVSNSIPGLAADKVSVVLVQAQPRVDRAVPAGAGSAAPAEEGKVKRMWLLGGVSVAALVLVIAASLLWLRRTRRGGAGEATVVAMAPQLESSK